MTKIYDLDASDIDCHGICKLSALLSRVQNLSTAHANALGVGGDRMIAACGAVWMIVRQCLSLSRPIVYTDKLRITTWHRGPDKTPTVLRDFDIFVDDERVGEAVISWVLADIESRRLVKPLSVQILADSPRPAKVKDIVPAKIKMPDGLTQVMSRTVNYSDTDINGHMNNTKYADIACDAIRYDRLKNRFISEVQLNYLHESFPGDEINVLCAQHEPARYVRGTDSQGQPRFDVSLSLSDYRERHLNP